MTDKEQEMYDWVRSNPSKSALAIEAMLNREAVNIIENLVGRGLVSRDGFSSYKAITWSDVPFDEQVKSTLRYVTWKHKNGGSWDTSAKELQGRIFYSELHLSDVNAICKFLVQEGAVRDCSTKDGVSIGCIDETFLYFKKGSLGVQQREQTIYYNVDQSTNTKVENYGTVHGSMSSDVDSSRGKTIRENKNGLSTAEKWRIAGGIFALLGAIAWAVYKYIGW